MTHKQTVIEALKRLRSLAGSCRYGGLGDAYRLAGRALQALDHLLEVDQPALFDPEVNTE